MFHYVRRRDWVGIKAGVLDGFDDLSLWKRAQRIFCERVVFDVLRDWGRWERAMGGKSKDGKGAPG